VRHATDADLPRIVEIYNATVPTRQATADTEPVSVDSRRAWFREHDPARRPILVQDVDGQVAAWLSFSSFYGRPAYRHTVEVSLYVAPEHRRRGVGRGLLAEAVRLAPSLGIRTLLGFIFSHNEPSLRLFRSLGFEPWGELPRVAEMDGREYGLTILGKRV
jgi:L-amino acid N-acyltransferase YncA